MIPFVGLTMGDPAGIGPEIIVKALASREVWTVCRPLVIGQRRVLEDAAHRLSSPLRFRTAPSSASMAAPRGQCFLVESGPRTSAPPRLGRPSTLGGRAALAAIETAVTLAQRGRIQAIVTAPVSKEGLRRAGSPFAGHTEMLAALTGAKKYAMMLVGGPLRVSLATIHIPLREVPGALTSAGILSVIELTRDAIRDLGSPGERIAVCGLNPHAGESGILGDEDRRIVAPAVRAAARRGIAVSGPLPADTVFHRAARGEFAAVVSMYHDQGLIPLKTVAFETGVNVTLGLPIIRTSVDHGTAYELAGKNLASPASLIAATTLAAALAGRRLENNRR